MNKMAELLKYFKCTQKKDKLYTGTLPDPDSPTSSEIPSSSIGITNTHMCQVQQEASSERSQGPYILLTPAQKFSIGKRAAENSITATLCYYPKTYPGIAWLHTPKFYSLGIVGSYPFRHTTGLLIHQYYIYQWNQVSPFANVLTLQYYPCMVAT